MGLLNTILNVVFPVNCVFCKKPGFDLCKDCLLNSPSPERECAGWVFPLVDYRHPPIKKSIWLLKYQGRKTLARVFAEIIYEKIIEELSELSVLNNFKDPIIIPIPLSKRRMRERGYNQAELISKEIIKLDPNSFRLGKDILLKVKETEHQANIKDRRKRMENLSGSFSVKNISVIQNKNIILIDDVLTTGATLSEAKKILKNSGAKKIIAFTIAH